MHYAAVGDNVESIQHLIDKGASLEVTTKVTIAIRSLFGHLCVNHLSFHQRTYIDCHSYFVV